MKYLSTAFLTAVLSQVSVSAQSAVLDFEDLTLATTYSVSDTFMTSGVTVNATSFTWTGGTVYSGGFAEVQNSGLAGGAGNELAVNNINLDFLIDSTLPGLDLMFGEYGGNLNININGNFVNFENFSDINGATIGGVAITVINGFGNDTGILSLNGSINSFVLGGQELWIDNISAVPVPAAIWLFASGIAGIAVAGKKYKKARL